MIASSEIQCIVLTTYTFIEDCLLWQPHFEQKCLLLAPDSLSAPLNDHTGKWKAYFLQRQTDIATLIMHYSSSPIVVRHFEKMTASQIAHDIQPNTIRSTDLQALFSEPINPIYALSF